MTLSVVPIYASILAIIFVVLSVRTLRKRRKTQVAVGDGGNVELLRASRVHANFAEYTPFALLLITLMELKDFPRLLLHVHCLALLVGRCSHAIGVSRIDEDFRFRVVGMALTLSTILSASAFLIVMPLLGR
jgi:uncharacterized membrane protein YecN with MAPEG domain